MNCGEGHRCGSDLMLLWLWCRLAAVAPIRPLAWELPYAAGVALTSKKQTNKNKQTNKKTDCCWQCQTSGVVWSGKTVEFNPSLLFRGWLCCPLSVWLWEGHRVSECQFPHLQNGLNHIILRRYGEDQVAHSSHAEHETEPHNDYQSAPSIPTTCWVPF